MDRPDRWTASLARWQSTIGGLARVLLVLVALGAVALLAGSYTGGAGTSCQGEIDHGIVAMELASTADQVEVVLDWCSTDGLRSSILRDWLTFIPGYTVALVCWCLVGSGAVRRVRSQRVARRLAIGAVAAGVLDVVENLFMWWNVDDPDDPSSTYATLATTFATAKFALLVPVLLFVVWLLFTLLWRLVNAALAALTPPRRLNPPGSAEPAAARPDPGPNGWTHRYQGPGGAWPHERRRREAVGLAFSGGGIRSASFCQGVLQALQADVEDRRADGREEDALLRRASYLASVSGGGYSAGAFQQALHRLPPDADPPPFSQGSPESEHVRRNIRFLWREPDGPRLWGVTGEPGTTPWNLTALLWPFLMRILFNIAVVAGVLYAMARPVGWASAYLSDPTRLGPEVQLPNLATWLAALLTAAVGGWILVPFTAPSGGPADKRRFRLVRHWLGVSLIALGAMGWLRFGWLTTRWPVVLLIAGGSLALFFVTMKVKQRLERARRAPDLRELLPLPSTALAVWFGLAAARWAQQARTELREGGIESDTSIAAVGVAGWLIGVSLVVILGFAIVRHLVSGAQRARKSAPEKVALVALLLVAAMAVITTVLALAVGTGSRVNGLHVWLGVVAAVTMIYVWVDQRWWSPHNVYKERLASTFAVQRSAGGAARRLDFDLSTPLEEWAEPAPRHPELVIACAVNILGAGPADPALPRRNAEEFAFGYEWVGGPDIGWARTSDFSQTLPLNTEDANLQAAVATSGAAVSTAMGANTMFAGSEAWLALLNLRLGVWLPHPDYVTELQAVAGEAPNRIGPWVKRRRVTYLLKELLRVHDRQDRFVNVSDGGHLGNTGLLELIKRGCTDIWFFDGSGGGSRDGLEPGAIETALRIATEDYGIEGVGEDELRTKLADIIADDGRPARSVTSFTFRYPDDPTIGAACGQVATVHVARCSLAEDAADWANELADEYDDFPYQVTFNQFFEGEEYAGYVRLGRELTSTLLAEA